MAIFKYQARDNKGTLVRGEINSTTATAVATYLLQNNLTPTKIEEMLESHSIFKRFELKMKMLRIETRDLIVFCRQMHALIKAGVPVVSALTYLLDSAKSIALTTCIRGIITAISSGQTLTQAFNKYEDVFTPVVVSIINAGENSGQLELAFLRVSEHLEFELNTTRQFKSVMRYPIIVITVATLAVLVINFMVVPAFARLFASFKTTLPLPTLILIASSNFMVNYWLYLLGGIIAIGVIIKQYLKTTKGRLFWDEYKLKIPVIGEILKKIILARFARIFAMMIQSGVHISQGLVLISKVVDNAYVSRSILHIRDGVEHGESIAKVATGANLFTPMILQMLNVGEETGSIEYMLSEIAKYYEEDIKYSLSQLAEIIEPILLIFMGGIVLLLALGVFLPMWNMVSFVH